MRKLLRELSNKKIKMVIVTNMKGKPCGLVTNENILEDIIGPVSQIETTLKN